MVAEQRGKQKSLTVAPRLRRAGWKEPRLLLGLVLVAASVVGIVFLINSMDRRTGVYVATSNITLGEPLTENNVEIIQVQLGDSLQHYLSAQPGAIDEVRANTYIGAGQFIAQDFITRNNLSSRRPINIDLPVDLSPAISTLR